MESTHRKDVAEAYMNTKIADISSEWANQLWDQDFTEIPDIPNELENLTADPKGLAESLALAIRETRPGADDVAGPPEIWSILSEQNIKPKVLVACLYHFMQRVDQYLSTVAEREVAILSAQLYFILISVPGSGAYSIIHPVVFEEAMDVFTTLPSSEGGSAKRKRPLSGQSQGSKAPRTSQRQKAVVEFDDSSDEDVDQVNSLSPQEMRHLNACLLETLKDLVRLIKKKSVNDNPQTLDQVVAKLAGLTRNAPTDSARLDFDGSDVSSCTSFVQCAYIGLVTLGMSARGEEEAKSLTLVFKHLMPNILMLMGDNEGIAANAIPQQVQRTKDAAIQFVSHMINEVGERSYPSMRVLLQHMCVKVPDKAEYRTLVSLAIATVLQRLPTGPQERFMMWLCKYSRNSLSALVCLAMIMVRQRLPTGPQERFMMWLCKYSRNSKIGYRVFALEVVSAMMEPTSPDVNTTPVPAVGSNQFLSQKFLLAMLIGRCSDKAPTVRAKALTCLGQFTSNNNPQIALALQELFKDPKSPSSTRQQTLGRGASGTIEETIPSPGVQPIPEGLQDGATPGNLAGGSPMLLLDMTSGGQGYDLQGFMSMVKKRACDEKVGVRKAALQVLENLSQIDETNLDPKSMKVIEERCLDPALSVRKQAMGSFTNLLMKYPDNKDLQRSWLMGVVPMVLDRETSAQEKCLYYMQEVIVDCIVPLVRSTQEHHRLAWELFKRLTERDMHEARKYFQKACSLWARQKYFKPSMMKSLISHLDSDHEESVWMLLAQITPFYKSLEPAFLADAWMTKSRQTDPNQIPILRYVLSAIGHLAEGIPQEVTLDLQKDLEERLMRFSDPPHLVSPIIEALSKLRCTSTKERVDIAMSSVCERVIAACEDYLSRLVLAEDATQVTWKEEDLVRHLYTLGDVAQICPNKTPERVFMLVQSLLAGPGVMASADFPSTQNSQGHSQPPLSQFGGNALSQTVRAHTFVTLGKLCLQHGGLAKKCIAAFARELETSVDTAVRNNVMIVMCDLCIRYPNLVDRYIPNLASCLKDKSLLVRRQTLESLTHLLLEDYIKWKGPLLFRFLATLIDESEKIYKFSEYCLVELLLKRQPTMLFQHFLESIFHFNDYSKHSTFNKFTQSDREKRLFSLKGDGNAAKRAKLYSFMLQNMEDEHRFHLTAKMCQDVLGAFVDQVLPLNEETADILKDTLTILGCKDIKLASLRHKNANHSDIVEEIEMAQAVVTQAKTKLISEVVRKNVIENIVPVVIALKEMLVKARSPLQKYLMLFLKELMKDYRNEIKDIFSADRQLAAEIEFDLRRFEEQQQAEEEAREAERIAAGPRSRAPSLGSTPARKAAVTPPVNKSPRTPKGTPPRTPRIPAVPLSPRMIRSPRMIGAATPGRNLVAQAIANSARKAAASAQRRRPAPPQPILESGENSQNTPGSEMETRSSYPFDETPEEDRKPNVRALRAQLEKNRAVSTPDKTIMDVTFHAAVDLSVIPIDSPAMVPSSLPIRVYTDKNPTNAPGTKSWTPQLEEEENRPDEMVLMFSPEHPAPKPRQWNVKVSDRGPPSTRKLSVSLHKLSVSPEAEEPAADAMETGEEKSGSDRRRRSTRTSRR